MAKFTKGPWTFQRSPRPVDGAHDYAINADGFPVIAEVFGRSTNGGWPPAEANARLIAAAPELLEAVEGALRIKELWCPDDGDPDECQALHAMRRAFDSAIRKATHD